MLRDWRRMTAQRVADVTRPWNVTNSNYTDWPGVSLLVARPAVRGTIIIHASIFSIFSRRSKTNLKR